MAAAQPAPTFETVLDDLEAILHHLERDRSLTYDALEGRLASSGLHLIKYVRFFERAGWVDYDRSAHLLAITNAGTRALRDPQGWEELARQAFAADVAVARDTDVDAAAVARPLPPLPPGVAAVGAERDEEPEAEPAPWRRASSAASPSVTATDEPAALPTPQPREDEMKKQEARAYASSPAPYVSGHVERYERGAEVGSGGIGTVYRGTQIALARDVAIKEVRNIFHVFADVRRDKIIERFVEILQTQASLEHPNIAQVYDAVIDDEYPYAVSQWAPKGSLRRLIDSEGRPPLNVAVGYFMQILHALHTAHERGIVHGSLKPENVVLDPAGNALLTDFGLYQIVERASGASGNHVYVGVGTVAYMSPEQFLNPNLATVHSDIYSLGIMFYEMLTGRVPGRRSPMPSSFFPDIPRKLDDIFDRMATDSPTDRFEDVRSILIEIYESPEVISIMDRRSGVLFLSDPLLHGELGLGRDWGAPGGAPSRTQTPLSEPGPGQEAAEAAEKKDESVSAAEPEETYEEQDAQAEAPEEQDAQAEAPAEEDAEDSDVLEKLDKYGALFEDGA